MGFIGCSVAENVVTGYLQSAAFDSHAAQYGLPTAVWVQVCIFAQAGATYEGVNQLVANAKGHAALGAEIYISGQPLYEGGGTCFLTGEGGAEMTDELAMQAEEDAALNVTYVGQFWLGDGEVADGCHANTVGQESLGKQALGFFG